MKKSTSESFAYDAFDLIHFIWEKKWMLLLLSGLAFVSSIVISLSITPRFKSVVVLYPAASVSVSKNLVETSSFSTDSRDILSFGEDEEAERMLQILHSNQIKDHIVKKFNLMEHYGIDPESAYPYTQLEKKYNGNIHFRRTEYMSLEIEVLDHEAHFAADIANEIAMYIDSTIQKIQHERALEAFNIVEKEYYEAQKEIEVLGDSLKKIRELGVIDYESQAASLNSAYTAALIQGNSKVINAVQGQMQVLSRYGGIYVELSKKLESEIERLAQLKEKYTAHKINVEQFVSQIFIVDRAVKSERKALPRRSVIVIISTLSAFAISLLVLLIAEHIKARS